MPDETQQLTPEPTQPEPISAPPVENSTPNQSSQSSDDTGQISEPNPIPVSPEGPSAEAFVPSIESVPTPEPPRPTEANPSPESAVMVKDQNPANEPLESAPIPEIPSEPNEPNITVEKHGNDVTITEVIQPKTKTAQMAGNEPLDIVEEEKTKKREENLKLANEKRQSKKREKINEILNLFSEKSEIMNDEVEKLLHVSDATATRYLETLEKEGKIKQVGKTGKGVVYEKI
jgi:hypothetical protein